MIDVTFEMYKNEHQNLVQIFIEKAKTNNANPHRADYAHFEMRLSNHILKMIFHNEYKITMQLVINPVTSSILLQTSDPTLFLTNEHSDLMSNVDYIFSKYDNGIFVWADSNTDDSLSTLELAELWIEKLCKPTINSR